MGKSSPPVKKKHNVIPSAAPAGGGGPGKFRDAPGPLGTSMPSTSDRHPLAPAGRYVVADAPILMGSAPHIMLPPTTVVGTTRVKLESTSIADVDVSVEVLPDGSDDTISGGQTTISSEEVHFLTPGYESQQRRDGTYVVDSLKGPYEIKGRITIQTVYGPRSKPDDRSLYGRGTTAADNAAGNRTLGFHESCHREDYLSALKSKPLPVFAGKPGMTVKAYKAAVKTFLNAGKKYFKDIEAESKKKTDESGYAKSRCIKDGKCSR